MRFIAFLIVISFLLSSASAQAPIPGSAHSNEPIDITASQSLEWHRNDRKFLAIGDAVAKQGTASVAGQTLQADYRESDTSNIDIYKLTAMENVLVKSDTSTAYGDHAVYNVDTGEAVLTGNNLKLVSPDQTITANDKFIYKTLERRALAIGNAQVIRADDKLNANSIEAVFKQEGGDGQQTIDTMEAKGSVVITTPTEVLTGDYAKYTAATNSAIIEGNVKITRGPNILQGARAEVDLNTNISKMFGSEGTGERVRGVFYPNSEKRNESGSISPSPATP